MTDERNFRDQDDMAVRQGLAADDVAKTHDGVGPETAYEVNEDDATDVPHDDPSETDRVDEDFGELDPS